MKHDHKSELILLRHTVTVKTLRLSLTQKPNNYRGSDVRGNSNFTLFNCQNNDDIAWANSCQLLAFQYNFGRDDDGRNNLYYFHRTPLQVEWLISP